MPGKIAPAATKRKKKKRKMGILRVKLEEGENRKGVAAGEFEAIFLLTLIHILLNLFSFWFVLHCSSVGLDYMLNLVDFFFLDHFLVVVVDLAVILMVWLGVNGTLFLMYFATLA